MSTPSRRRPGSAFCPSSSSSIRPCPTACCASGRVPMPASRSTRATRCSGIPWLRSPSFFSSCCRFAVTARLKLALIFLACAAPFILGWASWYFGWGTGSRGNYGELVAPRSLEGPAFEPLRGKWLLVAFDTPSCDAYCEKKLYFMRQLRTAQGKDQSRIERVWVLTGAGAPRPEL